MRIPAQVDTVDDVEVLGQDDARHYDTFRNRAGQAATEMMTNKSSTE